MKTEQRHYCVYGGQYGSEGKASAAEYWAKRMKARGHALLVFGENSPNSGHTSSKGATKNLPASSFWADWIALGPDAVIDAAALAKDWETVGRKPLFIHEHAALMDPEAKEREKDLVVRISSTGSGSGAARADKFIERKAGAVLKAHPGLLPGVQVLDSIQWDALVKFGYQHAMIVELSQGALLDTNFGIYPFCTSRSTLPRVAVERNGLGWIPWTFCGVYRTFPIRTGGPSGPTNGPELQWEQIGLPPEIATVTKRRRRVFAFSDFDFRKSISLTRPDVVMFTFLDYIGVSPQRQTGLAEWLSFHDLGEVRRMKVLLSNRTGCFYPYRRR